MKAPVRKRRSTVPELAPATLSEADGVRYLHLGTPWVQGAMRVRKPLAIELEYVQRMMVWLLLYSPEQLAEGHAVQLGLGAGAITRFCHKQLKMRTTVVELNPSVISANHLWFYLPHEGEPGSEGLEVLEQDAADFVAEPARAGTVLVLSVDLYDHDAASPVLDSEDFYRGCFALLAEGGVMSVNLFGRDASFERSAARIAAVFGEENLFSLRPTREGNTVVVAVRPHPGQAWLPERSSLLARADALEALYKLPAHKWLRIMRSLPVAAAPAPAAAVVDSSSTPPARRRAKLARPDPATDPAIDSAADPS